MAKGGPLARGFLRFVAAAERLNIACSRHDNPPVYAHGTFPWAAALEAAWPAIRTELDAVMRRRSELPSIQDLSPDARSITGDAGWKVFMLAAYGIRSPASIALCPQTWAAVSAIPGLQTAMFSILEPGKFLPPHRGPYNGVLRLHLGVDVPAGDSRVAIRIGGEEHGWRNGEALIFDDSFEHSAWNESAAPRIVLFVDFTRPLRFPANILNSLLLRMARLTPYLREGETNLRLWELRFHGVNP